MLENYDELIKTFSETNLVASKILSDRVILGTAVFLVYKSFIFSYKLLLIIL